MGARRGGGAARARAQRSEHVRTTRSLRVADGLARRRNEVGVMVIDWLFGPVVAALFIGTWNIVTEQRRAASR